MPQNITQYEYMVRVTPLGTEDFLLVKRYNRPNVLLYLDPPYLRGGDQYRHKFKMDDFVDLKALMNEHQETYLLNLSMTDPEMIGIFGKPDMVKEHHRPTMVYDPEKENKWGCGYWWKFYQVNRTRK